MAAVKATQPGFYGCYREAGDTFELNDEKDFSKNWMEKVEADKPAKAEKAEKSK
jgi:hypothetical protein